MLKKDIKTKYGISAKYWVISKIEIDRINLGCNIELYGYATKEAEKEKKSEIDKRNFYISFVEQENQEEQIKKIIPDQIITPEILEIFEKISQLGYRYLKLSEEFTDAEII